MIAAATAAPASPGTGNDLDTYADDLAELVQHLNLTNAIHVGHSTGGGEVARYIGRHGTSRVAKAVLISAIPPLMLKTPANPAGLPMEVFDGPRANVQADRSQFFTDLSAPFYGANRPGSKVSDGLRDYFWLQGMMCGFPAAYYVHQGLLRVRLHRGPEEVRHPHADPARRRRPDRPHRRGRHAVLEDREKRRVQDLQGRAARHVFHPEGRDQRRPARVLQDKPHPKPPEPTATKERPTSAVGLSVNAP